MLIKRAAEQDIVKVLDFGIAKLVNDTMGAPVSQIMGTPSYASPEQLQIGGQIDRRSDVYSLGVMIFEMLTGKLPFNASSFQGIVRLQLTEPPPPIRRLRPELPIAIEHLINQLMAKAPEQRPHLTVIPSMFDRAFENPLEPQRMGEQAFITADKGRDQRENEEAQRRMQEVSRARVEAETEKLNRREQSNSAPPRSQRSAEPIATPRAPNAKIKWVIGACILTLSSVILVYWLLQLNSPAAPSDGKTGSTSNAPTPAQSGQFGNIDDLTVVTLDAPSFRANNAVPVQNGSKEF